MAQAPKSPLDEFVELRDKSARVFGEALSDLARAILDEDIERRERIVQELAEITAETMTLADLLGRKRALLFLDRIGMEEVAKLAFANPVMPRVPFLQAIRDLIERSIKIVSSTLRPRWREVQRIYERKHAFALARSYSRTVTARVRDQITQMMQRGFTVDEAVRTLAREFGERIKPWAYAYGEVVYRTNLNTAYNAGMIRQVRESDTMRRAFPAWEVMGVADGDERENHRPVRGVIAAIESPIWNRFSPPLGYNCRHSFRSVSFDELKRLGLIRRNGTVMAFVPPGPPVDDVVAIRRLVQMGAAPDYPSFGRRPDSMIYG